MKMCKARWKAQNRNKTNVFWMLDKRWFARQYLPSFWEHCHLQVVGCVQIEFSALLNKIEAHTTAKWLS